MYRFTVSTIAIVDGRRRLDTIPLSSDCYGQRQQVRRVLCAKDPANEALFVLIEAGPGLRLPIETFTSLTFDETSKLANGIEVDLEVLLSLQTAHSAITKLIRDTETNPDTFVELASI